MGVVLVLTGLVPVDPDPVPSQDASRYCAGDSVFLWKGLKIMIEPITDIPEARYNALMKNDDLELTREEIASGWHFCSDWDGLLIGPGMGELEHCTCAKS